MIKRFMMFLCVVSVIGCSSTTQLTKSVYISDIYKAEPISRIAVFDLEFRAPASEQLGKTDISRSPDAGRIMADLLISELVGTGLYRIVERTEITKILEESKFSVSSMVGQKDARELGTLLGVDGIVLGTVHNYDLWDWQGGIAWGSNVSFSARLVSAKTGEVIWTINGNRNAERKGTFELAREVVKATICDLERKLSQN